MTSFSSRMSHGRWQARMAWLPPFGQGNGLDAPSWAPLADIAPELVEGLLAAFRHARPARGERVAKYNRLLEIEATSGRRLPYGLVT